MNIQKLKAQFFRDGFLAIEDFFDEQLMDAYHSRIVSHYGYRPSFSHTTEFLEKAATEVVPWFPQHEGVELFNIIENDGCLNLLTKSILGDGWKSLYCMTMFSKQGTKGQAWHQDCAPENAKIFNLNRLVYTHDISSEDGGQIVVVPGSHKMGLISKGEVDEDLEGQLVLNPKKGTLILLHGHTWHRVLPIKGNFRVSTNYRCVPEGTPADITDICVYRNMRYRFETNEVVEDRLAETVH